MDIAASGLPPVDTHVHVYDVPEMVVVGPVRVGLCGDAGKSKKDSDEKSSVNTL